MRRIHALLLVFVLANARQEVIAQTARQRGGNDSSATERSVVQRAQEHFQQGLELVNREHWEAALALFDESLSLYPTSVALYNRAICLQILHRYAEAIDSFERYRAQYADELNAEQRAEVESFLTRLQRLVGQLRVEVEEPRQATVLVDGREMAQTPLDTPLVLSAGRHTVVIRAQGYVTVERQVTVTSAEEAVIRVALQRIQGEVGFVMVAANVPGASVSVDGQERGMTPLLQPISLAPGTHEIQVSRPGYRVATTRIEVRSGQESRTELAMSLLDDLPANLAGELDIDVSEQVVEILLDGEPSSSGFVPIGLHVVEIHRPGFHPWRWEGEVVQGRPTRIEATLHPTDVYLKNYKRRARAWMIGGSLTLTVGVALLGTALGFFLWNNGRVKDWEEEEAFLDDEYLKPPAERILSDDELDIRYEQNQQLGDEMQPWSYIEWGLGAAGVAAAIIGAVVIGVGPKPGRYKTISVIPQPGGLIAGLTWRL